MTPIEDFIKRYAVTRYAFVLASFPAVAVSDRIRRIGNAASVQDLRRALRWARTGETPGSDRPRPKPARMTTPTERAPLYAAYAAARAKEQEIGYRCEDDSIIQAAVKAYETAEMARLRAQVAEGFAVAAEMEANSEDPLTTAYATQLRQRLEQAGPGSAPYAAVPADLPADQKNAWSAVARAAFADQPKTDDAPNPTPGSAS